METPENRPQDKCRPDNSPSDKWLYEYFVVRYMPCPERGEFLNIGLVMMCKRQKWLKGLIWIDEEKLRTFHPNANISQLERQTSIFERKDVPGKDLPVEEKYRWLAAEKSASVRVSPSHPGLINPSEVVPDLALLDLEFERLLRTLVL